MKASVEMKRSVSVLAFAAILGFAGTLPSMAGEARPQYGAETQAVIDQLLASMPNMDIDSMEALQVETQTLPEPGIDVLRAKVEETYTIDGIGEETVVLSGWIAVVHGEPVALDPDAPVAWDNSVVATEFVGLELRGESELFGSVSVTLNPSEVSIGRVGSWESAPTEFLIQAGLSDDDISDIAPPTGECADVAGFTSAGCGACYAPLSVQVEMEDLDLKMTTADPVLMYSYVQTIPPVGLVASTSAAPRALMHEGRAVGTLQSAAVKFREVIHSQPLDGQLLDERFNLNVAAN